MSAPNFPRSLEFVLKYEGGYTNHPKDPGGPTNLGVTLGEARRLGLDIDHDGDVDVIDIKLLTPADAGKVFKAGYWDVCLCDQLPLGVDLTVFDYAVNSWPRQAGKDLQRCLGATYQGELDGIIGRRTLNAAASVDPVSLVNALIDRRLAFMQSLSTWPTFGAGWANRLKALRATAGSMATGAPIPVPPPKPTPVPKPQPAPPPLPPASIGVDPVLRLLQMVATFATKVFALFTRGSK